MIRYIIFVYVKYIYVYIDVYVYTYYIVVPNVHTYIHICIFIYYLIGIYLNTVPPLSLLFIFIIEGTWALTAVWLEGPFGRDVSPLFALFSEHDNN